MNNTGSFQRTLKFRKRDIKANRKEHEVVALLNSSKVPGARQGLRPILVSELTGFSVDKVYRIKNKHLARIKYTPKRQSSQHLQQRKELLTRTKQAIGAIGLPNMTTAKLKAQL
jgi:hypothetical protein